MTVIFDKVPHSKEAIARHKRKEIRKVSRRDMGSWVKPIIDLCNASITEFFGEFARYRSQSTKNRVSFSVHPQDLAQALREKRYNNHIKRGFITKGDAFLGLGISSASFTQGFANEGLKTQQKWAVEMDANYLNIACQNSPKAYENAHLFCATVEEVEKNLLEPVDAFGFSMSCTNHSLAGRAKKGLESAEMGDEVTALFGVVEMIKAVNPAILISENVPAAKGSITYELLKKEISRLGYEYHEMILDQSHSGALDRRTRYWMVAVSKGLNIDPANLEPGTPKIIHENFGDIMIDVADDDKNAWHPISKLTKREEKNIAEGRNFKMKLIDETATVINTIPRNYTKHQVSNPHVAHKNGLDYRLIKAIEHADMKRVPHHLIAHCAETTAHEGLGQGIAYLHGVGLAEAIARNSFKQLAQQRLPL